MKPGLTSLNHKNDCGSPELLSTNCKGWKDSVAELVYFSEFLKMTVMVELVVAVDEIVDVSILMIANGDEWNGCGICVGRYGIF